MAEKLYTSAQMLKLLNKRIKSMFGNVNKFASTCGVDSGNAYNVTRGKANIMNSVINPLGYEVVPQPDKYRRITREDDAK